MFDLFDFWDGRDGLVDGNKVGDFLRCLGLNPTEEMVKKVGGTDKMGKSYKAKLTMYHSFSSVTQIANVRGVALT